MVLEIVTNLRWLSHFARTARLLGQFFHLHARLGRKGAGEVAGFDGGGGGRAGTGHWWLS
jgi:hypothetical protein